MLFNSTQNPLQCWHPGNLTQNIYVVMWSIDWNQTFAIVLTLIKNQWWKPQSGWIFYNFLKGEQITNLLTFKLQRSIKENVEFNCTYKANQLSMFCVTNDNTTERQKVNVTYRITCLGGFKKHHGKLIENFNFIVVHNNRFFVLDCCFCSSF